MRTWIAIVGLIVLGSISVGCPKSIPQPEIDAAEEAIANIEDTKDCAPETYRAAQTMMDRARALLKEERYEEAKTAMLAARNLADQARKECDKKQKENEQNQLGDSTNPDQVVREIEMEPADQEPPSLETVFFGFNESMLTDETRRALTKNADILQHHLELRVQVEGHCDNRGSTEYNLALGERRAMAVKQYLVKLGVNPNRMEIISYGEERPADFGQNEEAWRLNRRAEFSLMQ